MSRDIEDSHRALALIKFFKEESHYLSFKSGYSILRTPHYFRVCEDKGRGDATESCVGYWSKDAGHKFPELVVDGVPLDMKDARTLLIYPAHQPHDAWLQSWCVIEPHNDFEGSLPQMVEEFGSYFAVLPASNIEAYAKLLEQSSGAAVRYGLVQYSKNPLHRSLTVKNSEFSYQKEFRFFLGECGKDETEDKKIQLTGLDGLLADAGSIKLVSPSGKATYFALGHKKVVTA